MLKIDEINVCIPVVSAIIERNGSEETEILIQTRWKPERDPKYSGTIEIPAGWINRFESVYEALKREVFEETGLRVVSINPQIKTPSYSPQDDENFAFVPFCCEQQLKGGKPWVGFVFICTVEDKEPVPQADETRDIRWIRKSELKKMIETEPESFFTLHLGSLNYYLTALADKL